jgi:dolichyl-phosphate-mannose-protein mannosyltransferase
MVCGTMQRMNAASDAVVPSGGASNTRVGVHTPTRRWWGLGLLLLATGLRCWNFPALGLEHFDEGVYAFSGLWVLDVPFYTGQHFYAPPLMPGLIGCAYRLLGVSDLAAISVSLVAGTVTVLLVWWLASRWYGPAAGLAAGCLAALSDMHIHYSRMALTDVLLTLWFVLAVGCLRESLLRRSFRWAVAAGLATALAWNTKYNGWLPLLIALGPLAWWGARSIARRRPLPRRALVCWLMAAGVALVGYGPWFAYVQQQPGGYAGLLEHHGGYVVGWKGWAASFATQADWLYAFDRYAARLAVPIALLSAAAFTATLRPPSWRIGLLAIALLALALQASGIVVCLLLAGMFLLGRWVRPVPDSLDDEPPQESDCTTLLHAAWLLVPLMLTPFYHPYPRLVLPWLPAVWIAAGAAIAWILLPLVQRCVPAGESSHAAGRFSARSNGQWVLYGAAVLAIGSLLLRHPPVPTRRAWQRSDRYRVAARQLASRIPVDAQVLVYAEPPLLFYLLVGGDGTPGRHAQPLASPESLERWVVQPGRRTYCVLGPHRFQDAAERKFLQGSTLDRLRWIASIPIELSDTRLIGGLKTPAGADGREVGFDLYEILPLNR